MKPDDDAILSFDPWGERDATYVVLRNGMVVGRKSYVCDICYGPIAVGERHRAQREADDGKAQTFRFCAECCGAMARSCGPTVDDEIAIYDRYEIGRARAEQGRKGMG